MNWPYILYTKEEENEHGDMIPLPDTLKLDLHRGKIRLFRYNKERGKYGNLGTQWLFEIYWPYWQWNTKNFLLADTAIRLDWNKHQYGLQILGFGFGWDTPIKEKENG